jgi:hypothetical protein
VLASLPAFVDRIFVVDDRSSDRTAVVVSTFSRAEPNLPVGEDPLWSTEHFSLAQEHYRRSAGLLDPYQEASGSLVASLNAQTARSGRPIDAENAARTESALAYRHLNLATIVIGVGRLDEKAERLGIAQQQDRFGVYEVKRRTVEEQLCRALAAQGNPEQASGHAGN